MLIYYSYKSDIWSLGLVLIECATKVFPYQNARSYIDVRGCVGVALGFEAD